MPARNDRTFYQEYTNWEQGDTFGAGLEDVSGNPRDAYQALNMQVYTNGTLGVRPWLRLWEPAEGTTTIGAGAGPITGYNWAWVAPDASSSDEVQGWLYFHNSVDAAFLQLSGGSGNWEPADNPTGHLGTIHPTRVNNNNTQDFLDIHETQSVVGGTRVMNIAAPSGTNLTHAASFDPDRAAVYKSRMYVWGDASDPFRIHFSDNTGFDDLATATNFFDLGVAGTSGGIRVEGLYATSDALMIYRSDRVWNALTGASPESGVVREIGPARIPDWYKSAVVYKNRVMFLATQGLGLTSMTPQGADYSLDVVRPRQVLRNKLGASEERIETREALVSYTYDSAHFFFERRNSLGVSEQVWSEGVKSIDYVNEAFNMSGYWMLVESGSVASGVYVSGNDEIFGITMMADRIIAMCASAENQFITSLPVVHTRDVTLDRPSRADDEWSARIEDTVSDTGTHQAAGALRLRKVHAQEGNRVRVRRVIVDATYWKDNSNTNWYPADIACRVYQDGSDQLLARHGFTQASLANTDLEGSPVRIIFLNGAEAFSNEVQVDFFSIQTLAIRRIVVEYEYERYLERP